MSSVLINVLTQALKKTPKSVLTISRATSLASAKRVAGVATQILTGFAPLRVLQTQPTAAPTLIYARITLDLLD